MTAAQARTIRELAWRVERLKPSNQDPEKYHLEKDGITQELHEIARRLEDNR